MKTEIKKFLEFNGKAVYFLAKNGTWWIAIKPICEAIGIDYNRQFQNLKSSQLFDQLFAIQQMVGADNRLRKMVCLPERYIYGWLFQIRSESPELVAYQKQCCDLLYDYFHGSITSRETLIRAKTKEEMEEDRLEGALATNQDYQHLKQIRYKKKLINKQLAELDTTIAKEQLNLFAL